MAREFVIARGAKNLCTVVVVEISDGGIIGHGECEPQEHYGESVESVIAQADSLREKLEAGMTRIELLDALPPGSARNAVDSALWDLESKRTGQSPWQIAGLVQPDHIVTDFTISLDKPEAMYRQALDYVGWPVLKLKLGGDAHDLDRVQAVRAAVPESRFTIDANESWSYDHLLSMAPAMHELGVALIEQPLPASADHVLRSYDGPIPLCADESCHTRESLKRLRGLYEFVNIKLDKSGGLTEALLLADTAKEQGFRLMTGCMTGTSLAMAPATLVASLCEFVDIDGNQMLAEDRTAAMLCDRGQLQLPTSKLWG